MRELHRQVELHFDEATLVGNWHLRVAFPSNEVLYNEALPWPSWLAAIARYDRSPHLLDDWMAFEGAWFDIAQEERDRQYWFDKLCRAGVNPPLPPSRFAELWHGRPSIDSFSVPEADSVIHHGDHVQCAYVLTPGSVRAEDGEKKPTSAPLQEVTCARAASAQSNGIDADTLFHTDAHTRTHTRVDTHADTRALSPVPVTTTAAMAMPVAELDDIAAEYIKKRRPPGVLSAWEYTTDAQVRCVMIALLVSKIVVQHLPTDDVDHGTVVCRPTCSSFSYFTRTHMCAQADLVHSGYIHTDWERTTMWVHAEHYVEMGARIMRMIRDPANARRSRVGLNLDCVFDDRRRFDLGEIRRVRTATLPLEAILVKYRDSPSADPLDPFLFWDTWQDLSYEELDRQLWFKGLHAELLQAGVELTKEEFTHVWLNRGNLDVLDLDVLDLRRPTADNEDYPMNRVTLGRCLNDGPERRHRECMRAAHTAFVGIRLAKDVYGAGTNG